MFISKEKYEELVSDANFWERKNREKIYTICEKDDIIRKLKEEIKQKDAIIKKFIEQTNKESYMFEVEVSICVDHAIRYHVRANSHETAANIGKNLFLKNNKSFKESDIKSVTARILF